MSDRRPPGRTLTENVVGATLWNTLLLPARAVVSLFTSVVYYSVLSRSDVGLIFLLQGLANTLGVYVDLGIERTLPRFLPEVDAARGRAGVSRLLGRALIAKLLVLLPVLLGLFVFSDELVRALAERQLSSAAPASADALRVAEELPARRLLLAATVAALLAAGAFHDVFLQTLNAFFRRREWNAITVATGLLQPLLVAAAVLGGAGLPGVLGAFVAAALLGLGLSAKASFGVVRALEATADPRALPPVLPRFARFAALSWLTQLSAWLYDMPLIVLFAARSASLPEVALLGFAYKYARDFVLYVTAPLVGVLTPALVRVKTRDSAEALQDAQASLTRIVWLIVLPSGVGLALLTPRLVAVLYPEYARAAPLAVLLIVFVFAEPLLSIPQTVAMVCERYRAVTASRLLALTSVPLLLALTPRYGLAGAALAAGLARVLPPLALAVYTTRVMGLQPPWRFLGRLLLSAAGLGLLLAAALPALPFPAATSWSGRAGGLLGLTALSIAGGIVFLGILRLLGGLEAEDRRRLLALNLPGRGLLERLF